MIEEQYLIRQIKSGSQKALETVIDRYGSYVKAIAANIIKPPMTDADIEEVVSDVFLSLWNHPGYRYAGFHQQAIYRIFHD